MAADPYNVQQALFGLDWEYEFHAESGKNW
jgi:hypothetical protein